MSYFPALPEGQPARSVLAIMAMLALGTAPATDARAQSALPPLPAANASAVPLFIEDPPAPAASGAQAPFSSPTPGDVRTAAPNLDTRASRSHAPNSGFARRSRADDPYAHEDLPGEIPYVEGKERPMGYHLQRRRDKGAIIGGAIIFGLSYGLTALLGLALARGNEQRQSEGGYYSSSDDDYSPLLIPVAGPFVALGTAHPSTQGGAALVFDGLVQGAGVAIFIAGLALPDKTWVRNDSAIRWRLTPMSLGRSVMGMGVSGSF
jgi:hypothetical protein